MVRSQRAMSLACLHTEWLSDTQTNSSYAFWLGVIGSRGARDPALLESGMSLVVGKGKLEIFKLAVDSTPWVAEFKGIWALFTAALLGDFVNGT